MPAFESTAIHRAEYDPGTSVLSLWFTSSEGVYDYFLVPRRVFDGLCAAPSKGRFFSAHIRDRYSWRAQQEAP